LYLKGQMTTDKVEPQFDDIAVRNDRRARQLIQRAVAQWYDPLVKSGLHVPLYLAADIGVLLIIHEAHICSGEKVSMEYVDLLGRMLRDTSFQKCREIIASTEPAQQDEAIRTVIQIITHSVHGLGKGWEQPTKELRDQVNTQLNERLKQQDDIWLSPAELITIRAAAKMANGPALIDYPLLDMCLAEWPYASEHKLKTRRSPTQRIGFEDVSRRAGDIIGYTGVRPRLPTDNLIEILPSEWAMIKQNPMIGLDKIFNRNTLVHSKESPHDLIPELQVMVAFIIVTPPSLLIGKGPRSNRRLSASEVWRTADCRAKALTYKMIIDASKQVPFSIMHVHVGIYVVSLGSSLTPRATCFDLMEVCSGAESTWDIVRFDELVSHYFYYSDLREAKLTDGAKRGPWPELAADPFIFLTSASAAASTYTSVLAVILSPPGHWPDVLPTGIVPLRPVEIGRHAVMLVEADSAGDSDMYGYSSFNNLTDVAIGHVGQFVSGTDVEVRNAFLDILLGPQSSQVGSTKGRIEID
jgi:hypothetical protein